MRRRLTNSEDYDADQDDANYAADLDYADYDVD
jgi:hypothetical protein